jgi:hypothetical protein
LANLYSRELAWHTKNFYRFVSIYIYENNIYILLTRPNKWWH